VGDWNPQLRHRENRELLALARQADGDAQWKLILNHEPLIRSTVRRVVDESAVVGDRAELADALARDGMVLLSNSLDGFSGSYPQVSHWIRTVIRNHALRSVKREQRDRQQTPFSTEVAGSGIESAAIVPSAADTFEASVDDNDRARMLHALELCLDRLNTADPKLHQVVWLQYKQGWSQQQIKELLEEQGDFIGVGAVGKRVEKGRKTLGSCIRARLRSG